MNMLITILLSILAAIVIIISVEFLIKKISNKLGIPKKMSNRVYGMLRLFCGTVLLLFAFINLTNTALWAFITTLLSAIALGFFAMWSLLSNITSTLLLFGFKQIEIGNFVEFYEPSGETVKGKVTDINLFFTSLKETDNTIIRVPNNFFFQRTVRIYTEDLEETLVDK